jgi:hypothetical protein
MSLRTLLFTALIMLGMLAQAQAAVIVRAVTSTDELLPGEPLSLELRADLSAPVLGWGLDLQFDDTVLTQASAPTIGPAWNAAFAPDGDDLAAAAFPTGISGTDILLATLDFEALAPGQTALTPSVTPGDLNEGFPLDPTGFDTVTFEPATVTVLPEPATIALLAGVTVFMMRFGRRRSASNPAAHL